MINVLVTGSNGQLGRCIKDLAANYTDINFIFTDYKELDICNLNEVLAFFEVKKIDYCINCAAYTAVDNAETDTEKAYQINVIGAKNLAQGCLGHEASLIHISTDFVFDGRKTDPYNELDETNPLSVYGESKLKGEKEIIHNLKKHFIIRTSWLYSEHGNNFMKTMLRLSKSKKELRVINDQIGTPTYAGDLAGVVLDIIKTKSEKYGIYHYSNIGVVSWYDFAKMIFQESKINMELKAIKTEDYPTLAERPKYSVLDKTKIENELRIIIPHWRDSLKLALNRLNIFNSGK